VSWSREFDDPILIPGRSRPLRTLDDARRHMMRMSAKDLILEHGQTAGSAVLAARKGRKPF
jgi:hypothetical protein